MTKLKKYISQYWSICIVLVFISLFLFYISIFGNNIMVPIHDHLDDYIPWYKMIKDNNLFFSFDGLVPYLGGIKRYFVYCEYKIDTIIYMLFSPFYGFVVNYILKIVVSIVGFYYLSKEYFKKVNINISIMCGFLYGITPNNPESGLSFASLPIILFLILNSIKLVNIKNIMLLILSTMLCQFSYHGIFIFGYLLMFMLYDTMKNKKLNINFIKIFVILMLGFVMTEYRLFYASFFSNEETIKTLLTTKSININVCIKEIINGFVNAQYHCGSLHKYVVLPTCFVFVLYCLVRKRRIYYESVIKIVIIMIVFNSVIYGFDNYGPFRSLIYMFFPQLSGFSFARTMWFNSFLWYFLFMLVLSEIKNERIKKVCLILSFVTLCLGKSQYNVVRDNIEYLYHRICNIDEVNLTYNEFYSEDLFLNIKEDINYNNEWSIAFGFHPAILNYNGIYTLDGYNSFYPLSYKNQFTKLISPELEVNKSTNFENWGARAYIFSKDISFLPTKKKQENCEMLININEFRKMNGKYVFSLVEITNSDELLLNLLGEYNSTESPYSIYVYQLID